MRARDTRPWYDRAACSGDDPDRYETPMSIGTAWGRGRREVVREALEAGSLCDGCPVIRECARDAVRCDDSGTIRAGIPVPDKSRPSSRHLLARTRAALLLVANGAAPADARRVLVREIPRPTAKTGGGGS